MKEVLPPVTVMHLEGPDPAPSTSQRMKLKKTEGGIVKKKPSVIKQQDKLKGTERLTIKIS